MWDIVPPYGQYYCRDGGSLSNIVFIISTPMPGHGVTDENNAPEYNDKLRLMNILISHQELTRRGPRRSERKYVDRPILNQRMEMVPGG